MSGGVINEIGWRVVRARDRIDTVEKCIAATNWIVAGICRDEDVVEVEVAATTNGVSFVVTKIRLGNPGATRGVAARKLGTTINTTLH
jgi:hypothetical protein